MLPPINQPNEQIAQLQAQLARLQQENTELRSRLETCQLEQQSQSDEDLQPIEIARDRLHDSYVEHRLLAATAKAANALLTIADFEQAINTALQILGESLETDRTKVLESLFDDPARPFSRYHNVIYEWIRPGTVQQLSHTQAGQVDTRGRLESFFETFLKDKGFGGLLAEWDESLHAVFQAVEVKSVYAVPICVDEQWWGVLAFDDCREAKHRTIAEMAALQTAANCIGSAIWRNRIQRAREEAERQVLREREKAAQQRAAELAKANEFLRRSLDRLADERNLDSFLEHLLREAILMLDGAIAQIFLYDSESETLSCSIGVSRQGEVVSAPGLMKGLPISQPFPANITGAWQRLLHHRGAIHFDIDRDADDFWPGTIEWHRSRGNRGTVCIAMMMGARPFGMLGLAFQERTDFTASELEFVQALGQQATLAIQLTQLAEEAKLAALAKLNEAIAREQEQAAQERAAELAKVNSALQLEVIERHRAERLARGQAEALVRMLRAFATAPALDKLLGVVLQSIVEPMGDHSGGIWLYDQIQNTTILHINYEDGQTQQGSQITRPGNDRSLLRQWDSDYMQALRQQKILIQDLRQFADNPAYAAYHAHNQQRGIKTILVVALFFGETFLGSITLRRANYRDYKPEEIELIRVLAHQAALAIQLTYLADRGKQAAISEERNRMAREIHDTLAQSLTSIRMQLEAATRFLGRKPEQAQSCITFAQELAQSGLAEARRSVWALQPEAESYRHLSTSLESLATQRTAETFIPIEVTIVGTPQALPPDVGMNLLRIGQEALNNAIRHACARTIILTLTYAPDQIQLQIQDDGQGFDPQLKLSIGGFGFIGMQQRSERLGGTCTISSRLGQGTEVRVTVPVHKESQRG